MNCGSHDNVRGEGAGERARERDRGTERQRKEREKREKKERERHARAHRVLFTIVAVVNLVPAHDLVWTFPARRFENHFPSPRPP